LSTASRPPRAQGDLGGHFAESQHAGLSAIIRLADAPATAQAHSRVALKPPPPVGPPPSLPGWAAIEQASSQPPPASKPGLAQLPGLPLLVIVTIQVVLSVRLLRSNSAFNDEALYLWAGRLEWSHWLHGTAVPDFPGYFSGAPVVYPPLGAVADAVGGLAAARILSLLFMVGATVLLHGLTKRIFDPRSAAFAAALFVGLGSAQFLGAFATYDAMAVFLLALATWVGIRAAGCEAAWRRVGLLALAAAALVTADAAKYAATLFDPAVLIAIAAYHWHARGRSAAIVAGLTGFAGTVAGLSAALAFGGSPYWTGITSTTLARTPSNWPAFGIVFTSIGWVGVIVVLAVFGAIATSCASRSVPVMALVWTLVAASLLAPAEQARIHVFTSLFKHVAFGAWFAAPVAGYALTAFIKAIPAAKARAGMRVVLALVALSGLTGVLLAADHFGNWADTDPVVGTLTASLRDHPGQLLVDATPPFDYYLGNVEPWQSITSTPNYSGAALDVAISQHRFAVIMISYAVGGGDCGNVDPAIRKTQALCLHNVDLRVLDDIIKSGAYQLITRIPYKTTAFGSAYMVWARAGAR
jgi:hypothetical protein